MVQTNFDFIVCHVFDNVNIDLIPTGKSEFIFYISWKSNIGVVVNLVYKKKQVLTQNENTCSVFQCPKTIRPEGPSRSVDSWIYNYLCN